MTARERERRLATLEAVAAKRAAAEARSAYAAIVARLDRHQLRGLVDLIDDVEAGRLTEAESLARFAAIPGLAVHFGWTP